MSPETLFIKDRATHFLNQTVLSPVNAQKLAPMPEIAQTPVARQEKEEALTKTIQQIKDLNFTSGETNSLLKNMLNGFARESREWNRYAIRASLEILPFIRLKKITSVQIVEDYIEAVTILPSHTETILDGGLEALIEAGMILLPHMSAHSRKKTNTEVIPVLKQELKKRHPDTNNEVYKDLAGKIDDLDNSLKTGLIKPIDISPKDTTEIANKFKEFSKDLRQKRFSPEQFARLDLLVLEAIRDFGMGAMQVKEMSGMREYRIQDSIARLKASSSIPDRNVFEDSLSLQVQELLERGIEMTDAQIAHALGPGISESMVNYAKRRLRKRASPQHNQPQEETSPEQYIINLRRQNLSRSQIADQLDIPITRVNRLISKLIREEKIKRQIRRPLNHPIIERGVRIDAHVDQMQSNNPEISRSAIARMLNLTVGTVRISLDRLKRYRYVEQLIQLGNTPQQISQEMGISNTQAEFLIARLKKLRDFQRNLQSQQPNDPDREAKPKGHLQSVSPPPAPPPPPSTG